jgi:O-acetyl-ADP-ribose deacetylase (regulator of RNase III)
MITYTTGNILEAETEALVNTVNCVGIMGKGIALQFKQAHPDNYAQYVRACEAGEVQPGRMLITQTGSILPPHYIINFPTKRHWRGKSRLEDIDAGLEALKHDIRRLGIRSIAIPPLGCGSGGLAWSDVRPRIEQALASLEGVQVVVYEPQGAPAPDAMIIAAKDIQLTRARAMLLLLFDTYSAQDYSLSRLEAQKLAYLLQAAGEPLRLNYVKHEYGPYAHNLNHVLQLMEGMFIRGYGDATQRSEIRSIPGSTQAAREFLAGDKDAQQRLKQIENLIAGFETPYGMELLASVHWLAAHGEPKVDSPEAATEELKRWNPRKRAMFRPEHVHVAWQRLQEQDMISTSGNSNPLAPA